MGMGLCSAGGNKDCACMGQRRLTPCSSNALSLLSDSAAAHLPYPQHPEAPAAGPRNASPLRGLGGADESAMAEGVEPANEPAGLDEG